MHKHILALSMLLSPLLWSADYFCHTDPPSARGNEFCSEMKKAWDARPDILKDTLLNITLKPTDFGYAIELNAKIPSLDSRIIAQIAMLAVDKAPEVASGILKNLRQLAEEARKHQSPNRKVSRPSPVAFFY